MVVFTCNKCSAILKKNQTHIHVFKCRTPSVSCIDCNQDFFGYSFNSHTQCFTENEKYGKNTTEHQISKGEAKQEKLSNEISRLIFENKLSGSLKEFLFKLASSPNIPTKKSKFVNFSKTLRVSRDIVEKAWDLLESNKILKNSHENQKDDSDNKTVMQIPTGSYDKETDEAQSKALQDNIQTETANEEHVEGDENKNKKKKHKSSKRNYDEDSASLICISAEENEERQNKSEKIKKKKKDIKEINTELQENESNLNEENVKEEDGNELVLSENINCEKSGRYFSTLKQFFREQGNKLVPFKTVKKVVKRIRREHAIGMSKSEFYNKIMVKIQKKRYFSIEENGIRFIEL